MRIPGLCFLLVLTGSLASAQQRPVLHHALSAADEIIERAISGGLVPGAVLAVSMGGEIIHERAYGAARLFDHGGHRLGSPEEMTPQHLFDLASLTKVLGTTGAILLLVDRGLIQLDQPVHHHLPLFTGDGKEHVTIRHLLRHTSGMNPWQPLYYHARTREESYRRIAAMPLLNPVGVQRTYSDPGFMLLGYVIEKVSGMPLDRFLEENLWRPLGLSNTRYNPLQKGASWIAATSHGNPFEYRMVVDDDFGYRCDEDPEAFQDWRRYVLRGEVNDGNAFYANGGVAGHAGLFSTAADVARIMDFWLSRGLVDGRPLVRPETMELFLRQDDSGNGLGWMMQPSLLALSAPPAGTFGHTGFTGTYVLGVPSAGASIVLLTNRQHGGVNEDGHYPSLTSLRRSVAGEILAAIKGVD